MLEGRLKSEMGSMNDGGLIEMIKGKCSIVILSYNQVHYTKDCLESIRTYTTYPYEIIMIDNGSDKETIDYLEQQKDIRLIKNETNLGFAGGCNQGMELADSEYILLLNNDIIVTKNWLKNMIELIESDENIALVGPLTNNTVGKQKIAVPYQDDMQKMQKFAESISRSGTKASRTLRLTAFCLLFRKSLMNEIGMLDTGFKIGNYEDDDFCIRTLLAKKSLYICRTSFVHHYMNISFAKNNLPREEIMLRNKALLESKWNNMDWNHHSVANDWILRKVKEQEGTDILHIGCGLGAIGVELKENLSGYHIVGVEDHPIRRKIAGMFLDEVYEWDNDLLFTKKFTHKSYDIIIIECTIEKTGLRILESIKPYLKDKGQILVRIFNIRHITTLERLITGSVGGDLLCATSEGFCYYFDKNINKEIPEQYGYQIIDETEVYKSFSARQEKFMKAIEEYGEYESDARVYNRIYQLVL